MAAVAFVPKGHRNNMNSFPRVPRSGSQTWGPSSNRDYNNMYQQMQHAVNFPYAHLPTAQAAFSPQATKQMEYPAVTYHGINNVVFDSPASSNNSAQGSPRPFDNRNSISSQGFDGSSEEAVSGLSSPGDEYNANCYFAEHLTVERGSISLEPGVQFSVHQKDPRSSPPQYSSPNRSRQGSTSYPAPQHLVTTALQKPNEDSPVSPTTRRPQKPSRASQRRGAGQQKDFYTIQPCSALDEVADEEDDEEPPMMVTTLNAKTQLNLCKEVDQVLRDCLFWWLVTYKFDIPRNARARDIETAEDRDYEGFCAVVNDLTAKRWVPREAVHHERIAELNTVLAGPSEIRHMLAHPERHLKSDWRMLGLIAAAIEVCKILQYRKGHRQLFRLYQTTEAQISALKVERLKMESAMADMSISRDEKELK